MLGEIQEQVALKSLEINTKAIKILYIYYIIYMHTSIY